ncbi:SDR family NAD(P)-dependent oxidoreductase [Halorubrum miltondacostae]|uniref:SDR family NAD(P)-dependent oxidoreductase n=1 Tax=Halorubrum miltondacostae TaxID=3076378 RepID=A0ABD5M4G1_9EURY
MDLTGKTALVTGGAAGIGRGIAIELARGGANVVVADVRENPKLEAERNRGKTVDIIEELSGDALFSECDVGKEASVETTVNKTVSEYGGLDILVNNAGISVPGSVTELDRKDWDKITEVNLTSVYLTTKHAATHLYGSDAGRIINLASTAAFEGTPQGAGYCATKGGVVNLTHSLASGGSGISLASSAVTFPSRSTLVSWSPTWFRICAEVWSDARAGWRGLVTPTLIAMLSVPP